jgi:hypothetical protein
VYDFGYGDWKPTEARKPVELDAEPADGVREAR